MALGSFATPEKNSLETKKGNSVVITARTLFLLLRKAASTKQNTFCVSIKVSLLRKTYQ